MIIPGSCPYYGHALEVQLWSEEKQAPDYDPSQPILRLLDPDRADNILHSERGEVHCCCPHSGTLRPMAFHGFEADRNTLKYRCPAAAYDLHCAGRKACRGRSVPDGP